MKVINNMRMGPAAAQQTIKFWNVAETGEDEGEITLYGDVMSQRPVDWWTGEPAPGLYITPEGFMEDLEAVKDKARLTVKLNSCGGDLYTGIAIHNALKALRSEVNVVVEGIAASAASVIMCAGDTVTVFPGSLIMIHGVSVLLWDALNIQDMKRLIKSMDASERAVAEIYSGKTGLEVDTLRSMMTRETWMTGREAMEKGFADTLEEDGEDPEMRLSADRKILLVNGVRHNVEGLRNIPRTIPILQGAKPAQKPEANIRPANRTANKKEDIHMTLEELKAQKPELVSQIEQDAKNAVQSEAAAAERRRLAEIDSIAASVPDAKMVYDAKYGENRCTAQELSFRVMQQSAAAGRQFLADYSKDGAVSGTTNVGAAPNGGAAFSSAEQDMADIQAVVEAYKQSRGGAK